MGSNEGRAWVSLGGIVHLELSEGIFGLTNIMVAYTIFETLLVMQI